MKWKEDNKDNMSVLSYDEILADALCFNWNCTEEY